MGGVEAAIYWLKFDLEPDESRDYDAICEPGGASCENQWSLDNEGMDVGVGQIQLKIRDENDRIWINDTTHLFKKKSVTGSRLSPLLTELKETFGMEEDDVFDAIQDWIDEDEEVSTYGAEADYYSSLDEPYDIRDAPLLDISELLLIKDIDDGLYFGGEDHPVGLKDIFTVFGEKRIAINVNTASYEVLDAIGRSVGDDQWAEDIVDERPFTEGNPPQPKRSATAPSTPASGKGSGKGNKNGSEKVTGSSGGGNQIALGIKSNFFSAYVKVEVHNIQKSVHAVLKRDINDDTVSIIYWREE